VKALGDGRNLLHRIIAVLSRRLRRLGRRIDKILGIKECDNELPLGHGHRAQVLAEHLSKVRGASLVFCSFDGEPLTPIVHAHGDSIDVVGLGCLNCHSFVATPDGILAEQRVGDAALIRA